ncbi:glycosyltransferase [Romboutsia timonensis]|uniref:glycosyltransferase n=1 Tax=Romboutsia timonensis TaxID=1776391 RepID=UPI0008D9FBB7|nr:glycosyltransferase [Romboutsia timonensis]
MNKEIKYIGFYDLVDSKIQRSSCLAAVNKMNYIANAITRSGMKVQIVSPAWFVDKSAPNTQKQTIHINEDITLVLAPSFSTKNKLTNKLKYYFSQLWMFFWLINNVQKDEEIIAYHSLALIRPLYWAKKIKKFNLIYEVEEIYTDVINYGKLKRRSEFKMINYADKYIFSTELLNEKINKDGKPYTIIYGTYKAEKDRNVKFNDDKIHVVYAGTFDPRKGGSTAAAAGEYLDEKYHIHIIGFGSEDEKTALQNLIKEVSKKTKCTVTYDGLYNGEEYIKFLQKCDIGLSTQTPNAEYNDTSFPSKVLSYMANGLRVVSIRIKAIEKAKISKLLYYYDKDCPNEIAKAIKSIDYNGDYDSRVIIKALDTEFTQDLKHLLEV